MKYAFLFPGQGAQEVGMGKTLLEEFAAARRVFEVADGALGFPLSDMILNGPESELQKTEFTQPAIMTVGIALHSVLVEELGVTPAPICSAGHSLGEYTAHVAAGTLALEDAVRLVHLRGKLMQEAVPLGVGAMAAIMGLSAEETEAACREVSDEGRVCEAANYNAPNQTVISGHREAVDEAVKRAKERGAKKAIPLKVSAPFHCSLMKPMARMLQSAFKEVSWHRPSCSIVANVNAEPVEELHAVRDVLYRQTFNPVRWVASIHTMERLGVETFIEFGPGNVLSGLVKRTLENAVTLNVRDSGECRALAELLKGGR